MKELSSLSESINNLLKEFLGLDKVILFLLFSFFWVFLYYSKRFIEFTYSFLFLRMPSRIHMQIWQHKMKVNDIDRVLRGDGDFISKGEIKEKIKLLEDEIKVWDKKLQGLSNNLLSRLILSRFGLNREVRKLIREQISKLEIDLAILQCISGNPDIEYKGYATISEYEQITDQDAISFIMRRLNSMDDKTFLMVLYLLQSRSFNKQQVQVVRDVVKERKLDTGKRKTAVTALSKLESHTA